MSGQTPNHQDVSPNVSPSTGSTLSDQSKPKKTFRGPNWFTSKVHTKKKPVPPATAEAQAAALAAYLPTSPLQPPPPSDQDNPSRKTAARPQSRQKPGTAGASGSADPSVVRGAAIVRTSMDQTSSMGEDFTTESEIIRPQLRSTQDSTRPEELPTTHWPQSTNTVPFSDNCNFDGLVSKIDGLERISNVLEHELKTLRPLRKQTDDLLAEKSRLEEECRSISESRDGLRQELQNLQSEVESWKPDAELIKKLSEDKKILDKLLKTRQEALDLNRQEVSYLQGINTALSEELALTKSDLNTTSDDLQIAEGSLKTTSTALQEEQARFAELSRKYKAASDDLNRIKIETRSLLGDDFFIKRWVNLRTDIERWCEQNFKGKLKRSWSIHQPYNEAHIAPEIHELSPDIRELMKSDDRRHWVAQAYVWAYLEHAIFYGSPTGYAKGLFWAHEYRPEVSRLEHFLRPRGEGSDEELRKFYKWKSSTTMLFTSKSALNAYGDRVRMQQSDIENLVAAIHEVLRDWALPGDKAARKRGLEHIITSAIDLDSHMNEQWAMYAAVSSHSGQPRFGFEFDSSLLVNERQDVLPGEEGQVTLVLAPALVRFGTIHGQDYRKREVLQKGRVLANKKREHRGQVLHRSGGRITGVLQTRRENMVPAS